MEKQDRLGKDLHYGKKKNPWRFFLFVFQFCPFTKIYHFHSIIKEGNRLLILPPIVIRTYSIHKNGLSGLRCPLPPTYGLIMLSSVQENRSPVVFQYPSQRYSNTREQHPEHDAGTEGYAVASSV